MKTEEINKFVLALVRDKPNFVTNFSDLLVKVGVCVLHDTNAETFVHECSGGQTFKINTKFTASLEKKKEIARMPFSPQFRMAACPGPRRQLRPLRTAASPRKMKRRK